MEGVSRSLGVLLRVEAVSLKWGHPRASRWLSCRKYCCLPEAGVVEIPMRAAWGMVPLRRHRDRFRCSERRGEEDILSLQTCMLKRVNKSTRNTHAHIHRKYVTVPFQL